MAGRSAFRDFLAFLAGLTDGATAGAVGDATTEGEAAACSRYSEYLTHRKWHRKNGQAMSVIIQAFLKYATPTSTGIMLIFSPRTALSILCSLSLSE